MRNGYEAMHDLDLQVRADMLETVAGFEDDGWRVRRELHYAIDNLDDGDAESLRWLACVIARRVVDLEGVPA